MTQHPPFDDGPDDLDKSCMLASRQAERFHGIVKEFLYGTVPIKNAYAFKDRVKPFTDIREKVLRKRKIRPSYEPADVKDASGFRIVCLFNCDIPRALEDVISLIKTEGKNIKGGMVRIGLEDIKEIEIHNNRRENDPHSIVGKVKDILDREDLRSKLVKSKPQPDFSSYSSVHVILETNLLDSGRRFLVATEIQLRSVFEEAWSEISHRLGYGPDKRAAAEQAVPLDKSDERWKIHLDALKALADGCAQYSDNIAMEAGYSYKQEGIRKDKALEPRSIDSDADDWQALFKDVSSERFHRLKFAFSERNRAEALAQVKDGKAAAAFLNAGHLFEALLRETEAQGHG